LKKCIHEDLIISLDAEGSGPPCLKILGIMFPWAAYRLTGMNFPYPGLATIFPSSMTTVPRTSV